MAHQVVKYRLTSEGTIPDFLYLGEDGVGGMYVTADPETPSPRDNVMIGITNDGATGDFEVIATQSDLQTYLTSIGSEWTQPAPTEEDQNATEPFDAEAAAAWVWGRLTALNS